MTIKVIILLFLLGVTTIKSVSSSEESIFLHEIVDQYSVPMVISFLHERISVNLETIKKIKSNQTYLDRDTITLAEKSLSILGQHLTTMDKADYFDFNGTEKIKQFIEQFTMSLEMLPIQSLDSLEMGDDVDRLIDTFRSKDIDLLITETNQMIANYINDLKTKETDQDNNRLQKLSASLAKVKLEPLFNYAYKEPRVSESDCYNRYGYANSNCFQETVDKRKDEVEIVLNQVKKIVGHFYSKFNYLGDPNKPKRSKIVVRPQKTSTTTQVPEYGHVFVTGIRI